MEQLGIAIETLKEKDDVFIAEVDESVERCKKEDAEYREYAREHWGAR